MKNPNTIVAGSLDLPGRFESALRIFSAEGIAPTMHTCQGGGLECKIIEYESDKDR